MTKNIGFHLILKKKKKKKKGQFHGLWVGSWLDCDMCYSNNSTSHLARVTHDTWLPKIGRNMPITLFIVDYPGNRKGYLILLLINYES